MLAMSSKRGSTLPTKPSCDLLILDRAVDPIAPIVHEWTYEAMVHDLLPVSALGLYRYTIETNAGPQAKEAVLSENDPLWVELRHKHIAAVLHALAEKAKQFSSGKKGARLTGEASTGAIKKVVESLPQFMEMQAKLSAHTSIAAEINDVLRRRGLSDVGRVEEEVIFGEATSKDVIALLNQFKARESDMSQAEKLRLLLLYAATHPEKFDAAEKSRWMKATGLSSADLDTVINLEKLGVRVTKRASAFSSTFKTTKSKRPTVHERQTEWDLSRFLPTINVLARSLDDGSLSREDFPGLGGDGGAAAAGGGGAAEESAGSLPPVPKTPGKSARSARTTGGWAKRGSAGSDIEMAAATGIGGTGSMDTGEGHSRNGSLGGVGGVSHKRSGSTASSRHHPGRRLVVFVLGGVTRGEMREAHALSETLGREVIIGGTEVLNPDAFVAQLARLCGGGALPAAIADDDEIDLDDLIIE